MVAFTIGCRELDAEGLEQFNQMIDMAQDFEGLEEIYMRDDYPGIAILQFGTIEQARAAQWMLEINGSEGVRGDAGADAEAGGGSGDTGIP